MRRCISLLVVLVLCVPLVAFASPLDLTNATQDDLLVWREQIDTELIKMGWYPYEELKSGSSGEQVTRLQARLLELNYAGKEPTGKYDANTGKAVSAFLKANGKEASTSASIDMQKLLFSDVAIAKPTPTPAPTKTPKPTPTPEPTPVPENLTIEITKVRLYSEFNTKVFSVNLKNHSREQTIDAFTLERKVYDKYGEQISKLQSGAEWWKELSIKPGKTFSMGSHYWYLFGEQTAAKIEVAVSKFHTKDGQTVVIDPADYVWVTGELE